MRSKIALAGVVGALLSVTPANAAGANAPQSSNDTQSGNVPPPAQPTIKKNNALLPALGGLLAVGGGIGAAAAVNDSTPAPAPVSP